MGAGGQYESVRLLVEQVLTGQRPVAAEHHHGAERGVRVDSPRGPDVRVVLKQVADCLLRGAGAGRRHRDLTSRAGADDDEQGGLVLLRYLASRARAATSLACTGGGSRTEQRIPP
jgi:hypothetical protein